MRFNAGKRSSVPSKLTVWRKAMPMNTQGCLKRSEVYLNVLRSVSAILVLFGHCRILIFQDYPTLVSPSHSLKLIYFATGLGRPAVIVFFVLSGYLVTIGSLAAVNRGDWNIVSYLSQR